MNKKEYLERLERLLSDISQEERQAAVEYYTDYLEDAGPEGEREAMEHLGPPEDVAAALREGLQGGREAGSWTENGYESGAGRRRYDLLRTGRSRAQGANGQENSEKTAGRQGKKEYSGDTGWERRAYRGRREKQGIGWLLLVIGGIICLGVPLVSVLGSVLLAIAAAALGLLIGGFALALGCCAGGIALLIAGILKLSVNPGLGLIFAGGGCLCLSLAGLAFTAGMWVITELFPRAVQSCSWMFHRMFGGRRSRA